MKPRKKNSHGKYGKSPSRKKKAKGAFLCKQQQAGRKKKGKGNRLKKQSRENTKSKKK